MFKGKRGMLKAAPVKRHLPRFLFCILSGALLVSAVHWAMLSLSRPELFLRLVPVVAQNRTRLVLRFTNIGKRDLALPVGGMEYFVFMPSDESRRYTVHVYDGERSRTSAHATSADGNVTLKPGKSIDVGDIYPHIRSLPPGGGMLKAVYSTAGRSPDQSQVWAGVAHSPYMTLEVVRN